MFSSLFSTRKRPLWSFLVDQLLVLVFEIHLTYKCYLWEDEILNLFLVLFATGVYNIESFYKAVLPSLASCTHKALQAS